MCPRRPRRGNGLKFKCRKSNSIRFAEKFHWPTDMVLVIGFGIVPTPTPPEPTAVKIPLISPGDHADLLVFIENRGVGGKPPSVTRSLPPATQRRCASCSSPPTKLSAIAPINWARYID